MMSEREAKHALRDIIERMLKYGDVHVTDVSAEFMRTIDPSELVDLRAGSFGRWLQRVAKDLVSSVGRSGNGQLSFVGMDTVFDRTVTTIDTTGSPVLKLSDNSTVDDIKTNLEFHNINLAGATTAKVRAQALYDTFVPVMEANGFMYLHEAIVFLGLVPE